MPLVIPADILLTNCHVCFQESTEVDEEEDDDDKVSVPRESPDREGTLFFVVVVVFWCSHKYEKDKKMNIYIT